MKRTALRRRTPIRSASARKPMRDRLDAAWSKAVRARWGSRCQFAAMWGIACWGPLDAHHIYPKSTHPHIRHLVINGICACRAHHQRLEDYPTIGFASCVQKLERDDHSKLLVAAYPLGSTISRS